MKPLELLLVDDSPVEARLLEANLHRPGEIRCHLAFSALQALETLRCRRVHAVITDLVMPDIDGIELTRRIRAMDRTLPIVILTVNATLERAVEGIRAGATEFLPKPVDAGTLITLVERAVRERPLREEVAALRRKAGEDLDEILVGRHPRMDAVRRFARQVARAADTRVLITGESGTGKSRLARAIHDLSEVSGRFVEVNCAALPANLLESELFGHERGAFTDAKSLKRGLIELADGGTLFLDEIGSMSMELQAKLLLFLEARELRRVGGVQSIPIHCRVIAASNQELTQLAREGRFRQDLLYRLAVAEIEMPPLRTMPSVIVELARRFIAELAEELRRTLPEVPDAEMDALTRHSWPGNVRELRNTIERSLILYEGGPLEFLPPLGGMTASPGEQTVNLEYGLTLEEVERRYIAAMLETREQELQELAASLGISRKTLWEKRRRFGL